MAERITLVTGAFDKRHANPKQNYGIHGMELRFVLKGDKGATQFVVYTPMFLTHVQKELWENNQGSEWNPFKPMGADIGYHSKVPTFDGQQPMKGECPYTDGPCYYDGSGLQADEFMPTFLAEGSDAVWKMLEERYEAQFGENA